MDALIVALFLLNNIFWMVFMYILIPVARENSDSNKKEIDLSFPFPRKKANINKEDLSPNYDELGTVSLSDVAESFGKKDNK